MAPGGTSPNALPNAKESAMTRLVLATAVLLLQGCATTPMNVADLDGQRVCDQERMEQIERAARRSFTELRWVQCPTATVQVVRQ